MNSLPRRHERLTLLAAPAATTKNDLASAVRGGLSSTPKSLPCRFLYDQRGSELFEQICDLPEYYLTRAEHEILTRAAPEIAAALPSSTALVELGSGSSIKTRVLIEAFLQRHGRLDYLPVDISPTILEESALSLLADYPSLEIVAIAAEYRSGIRHASTRGDAGRLVLWLGSNVGNFQRDAAAEFLRQVCAGLTGRDRMLIGVDLRKDPATLEQAYNDSAGVTEAFNKNLLLRINAELGANFVPDAFEHRAVYDDDEGAIEISLRSTVDQTVTIDGLDMAVVFAKDERVHTEDSVKYSVDEIQELARKAGMRIERQWFDAERRFCVTLLALL